MSTRSGVNAGKQAGVLEMWNTERRHPAPSVHCTHIPGLFPLLVVRLTEWHRHRDNPATIAEFADAEGSPQR